MPPPILEGDFTEVVGLVFGGERDLHLLGGLAQALEGLQILARVEAVRWSEEGVADSVRDRVVDVVAAEERCRRWSRGPRRRPFRSSSVTSNVPPPRS